MSCVAVLLAHRAVPRTTHNVDVIVQEDKISLVFLKFAWNWSFGLRWEWNFLSGWRRRCFRIKRHSFLNGLRRKGLEGIVCCCSAGSLLVDDDKSYVHCRHAFHKAALLVDL
ncbi:hypothetical protein BDR05DRAFT_970577 [Suillus weaverae]|nr:hypothetical protein BDR05DRAFT_970577 [Suillus weaverae]